MNTQPVIDPWLPLLSNLIQSNMARKHEAYLKVIQDECGIFVWLSKTAGEQQGVIETSKTAFKA